MSETQAQAPKEYRVIRDGDIDLAFTGEKVAEADTRKWDGSNWSTRWDEYTLYRTDSGKVVVETVSKSQWQGEDTTRAAAVYDTLEEAFAGTVGGEYVTDTVKELFDEAGYDPVERV